MRSAGVVGEDHGKQYGAYFRYVTSISRVGLLRVTNCTDCASSDFSNLLGYNFDH